MGGTVLPPCSLASGQTMVGVMAELLQKDLCQHAAPPRTAAASVPDPAAGHCQPTPLPETPKHSQASLAQSLVGSRLLSPGSWFAQDFVCALQESLFLQSRGSSVIKSH